MVLRCAKSLTHDNLQADNLLAHFAGKPVLARVV